MQFMTMLKSSEKAGQPPADFYDKMGEYIGKMAESGKVVLMGGLMPTEAGAQVRGRDGGIVVSHGPFTEATEVVGGYAILQADSLDEVIASVEEFVQLHIDNWPGWTGVSEIRQIAEF